MTPALALGTMRTSGFFDGLFVLDRDPEESGRFLRAAVAGGIRLVDTAPIYARGQAELDVGRHVPPDVAVWTKVGVDIRPPLPRLDYTLDGMWRTLLESLERLRRPAVDAVFVHNPPASVLPSLDLAGLRARCEAEGVAAAVGVSLLRPADALRLRADQLPPGSLLMCEAAALEEDEATVGPVLAEQRLVVRSVLAGGRLLEATPPEDVQAAVRRRLAEVEERWAPEAVVVGPRTREQLAAYVRAEGGGGRRRPAGTTSGHGS